MKIFGFLFSSSKEQLTNIQKGINQIMFDLTALKNAATQETSVEQSAIALLTTLSSQIQTMITNSGASGNVDPVQLQAVVDQLNANATTLAHAVTLNTPAATATGDSPTPPPPPPPPPPPVG